MLEIVAMVCALSGPPSCVITGFPVESCEQGMKTLEAASEGNGVIRRVVCGELIYEAPKAGEFTI